MASSFPWDELMLLLLLLHRRQVPDGLQGELGPIVVYYFVRAPNKYRLPTF